MSTDLVEHGGWARLGPVSRLPVGSAAAVEVDGEEIAVFHTEAGLFAVDNDCLHMAAPLSRGGVLDHVVTCPWHGWRYDLRDGRRVDRRGSPTRTHDVEVRDGVLFLRRHRAGAHEEARL